MDVLLNWCKLIYKWINYVNRHVIYTGYNVVAGALTGN